VIKDKTTDKRPKTMDKISKEKGDEMKKPLRVLIIEDSEADTLLVLRELKRGGYDPIHECVETAEAMKAALSKKTWDLILADYSMPHFSAPAALALLKESSLDIPFIIVSGSIGEDIAVKVMKAGAHDYLMKNNLARLVPAIEQELREAEVRRKLRESEKALQESEERYRQVVESATDIIYTVDEKGNFTYANPAGLKVTGYPLGELRKLNYADLVLPEHRERVSQIYANQFRGRLSTTYVEFPFIGKAGEIIWFGQNSTLVIEGDKIAGFHIISRDITERKRAEEASRESEQRYRNLVENAPDVIFTLAPDGTVTSLNPAFETITGWSGAEWLHKQFAPMLHPNDLSRGLELFQHVLKGEKTGLFELKVLGKSGDYLVAEFTITPQTQNGSLIGILGVARDITERKKAEEALKKSEEEFKELYDDAPIGYIEYNTDGRITNVNHTELEMLGYSVEEMIGQPPWKFVVEEDIARQQVLDKLAGIMPPIRDLERTHRRKDGTTFPALVQDRLFQDAEGKILGIRATIQDITERKRAEEALQITQFSVEHAPESVLWINPKGQLDYVNEAACRALGYSQEELLSMSLWDINPDFPPESWPAHWQNLPNRGPLTRESNYRAKGGKTFPVEITADYLKYADKEYSVAFVRDITGRKQAEQEMMALQEQLRQSQKMEAIGRLAGGVAHDFNNLLTVISGYSQLSLSDLQKGDPLWENIREIQQAAGRAADLTRQLLAFSRRQILEFKTLDLNQLTQGMEKMLRRMIGEDIELMIYPGENLGSIRVDPGQMEQVIMNLAVNARDAMPSGGKLILETDNIYLDEEYARNHISVKPGPYVRLSITDTGCGMTPDVRERVFEPFFTTKEKEKGTGLGLSTVYGIVKQSDGNIWVYSEPGKGTTFKIYLPRMDEPVEVLIRKAELKEIPRGNETVLVVEDEEVVRKLAVQILKKQGYEVLQAALGGEALLVLERHPGLIYLILTDVVMPGMSGPELVERLRQVRKDFKVLYMSGYTDESVIYHGVRDGETNFIQKPFTLEMLARRVREVLNEAGRE
jgi:PAS domain S-box-containing protein